VSRKIIPSCPSELRGITVTNLTGQKPWQNRENLQTNSCSVCKQTSMERRRGHWNNKKGGGFLWTQCTITVQLWSAYLQSEMKIENWNLNMHVVLDSITITSIIYTDWLRSFSLATPARADQVRPGCFLMTGRAWLYWPVFCFTGQNGPSGTNLARPFSSVITPCPFPALFIFA